MSDFTVRVVRIDQPVVDHPNADRLSLVRIAGFECISNKVDGRPRYQEGDYVVYIPEASVLPEWLLKRLDMWDEANNKGFLAGSEGNRVKTIKLRGIVSQGVLLPVEVQTVMGADRLKDCLVLHTDSEDFFVDEGEDVAAYLGITKYEPPIPVHMAGAITPCAHTKKYDFESIQKLPDLFTPGEAVVATEKTHGTFVQIGFVPGLAHPECFGQNGDIYVCSKGYGQQGLVFSNSPQNDTNLYVRVLRDLLAREWEGKLAALCHMFSNQAIRVFGEIIGPGVQDLHYGLKAPELRVFDIMVNEEFLPPHAFRQAASALSFPTVPVLYEGPYDLDALVKVRDGKDYSGSHVREGIVIRAADGSSHEVHGRKIGKWVSPDYLLRKNATEFQ